ncbi:MAG: immune inhibitor A [Anaerolineae bacterium]
MPGRVTRVPDPVTPSPSPTTPTDPTPEAVSWQTAARLDEAVVPIHDPVALRALLTSEADSHDSSDTTPSPVRYRVGDRRRFRLNTSSLDAKLVHVTDHTYTWLATGVDADLEALAAAADYFESEIYPAVRGYFGYERSPGIDGDVHVSILHYRDPDDDAAGYFSPSDELPLHIDATSNEAEMFYVNLDGMDPDEDFYFAVLAHEFQHMIHWSNDRNEADWLDEGLAELACRLAGFDPGRNDESFIRHPDTQLNNWPYDGNTAAHYGAGYLFALYLWERFGDEFIWDLAHHPADGMAALDAVLASHETGVLVDEIFADWVIVNAIGEGDFAYANEGWKAELGTDASHDQYPVSREADVYPYATDYVELTGEGRLLVRFEGTPHAELLPTAPRTGKMVWWSNRGNRSDARLTRRFDLSGLSSATFRFWTWYDLETGYDYVYLSASDDGGEAWEVLQGSSAASQGDYGWAYNGQSDGWVEEEADLSSYAGGEVWVRFDYVTDDSINGAGFLVDDFSIPELGLMDSCEEVGEWEAEGFVLAGPMVPQRWVVQLVELPAGGTPQVRRMSLDEQRRGQMELTLGGEVERTLLVISALARATTERASYQYEITYR